MMIAILGANGHVGRALAAELKSLCELYLFARISGYNQYADLFKSEYDAIINCVGVGNSDSIKNAPLKVMEVTEYFDELIHKYQCQYPTCKVIHLSSGAVFGTTMEEPINLNSGIILYPNQLDFAYSYGMTKLYSEMKHRLSPFCYIDIRLMAFTSIFQPMDAPFFMSDVIKAIKNHTLLTISAQDMIRDYIHPADLVQLNLCCIRKSVNAAYDTYSLAPASKFEILKELSVNYHLEYEITGTCTSTTGMKSCYYSRNHSAKDIQYQPVYSTLSGITNVLDHIMMG